jgi:hypothetical protein
MTHAPVARLRRDVTTIAAAGALEAPGRRNARSRNRRDRSRRERGVTTAEYAVVTAAGCGFGGVLLQLLTSDWGKALVKKIFDTFLAMIGLG